MPQLRVVVRSVCVRWRVGLRVTAAHTLDDAGGQGWGRIHHRATGGCGHCRPVTSLVVMMSTAAPEARRCLPLELSRLHLLLFSSAEFSIGCSRYHRPWVYVRTKPHGLDVLEDPAPCRADILTRPEQRDISHVCRISWDVMSHGPGGIAAAARAQDGNGTFHTDASLCPARERSSPGRPCSSL